MCLDDRETHFTSFLERLETFRNWVGVQTPESLASVGFFRTKEGVDEVQCFHCGIRIFDWEPHDEPLSEHLRWSSNCRFAKLLKSIQTSEELIEKCIGLFDKVFTLGGADIAGNNSVGTTNRHLCNTCCKVCVKCGWVSPSTTLGRARRSP